MCYQIIVVWSLLQKKLEEKVAKVYIISTTWFLLSFFPSSGHKLFVVKKLGLLAILKWLEMCLQTTDWRVPDVLLLVSFLLF